MNVGELRKALEGLDDDVVVIVQGYGNIWLDWTDTADVVFVTPSEDVLGPGVLTVDGTKYLLIS